MGRIVCGRGEGGIFLRAWLLPPLLRDVFVANHQYVTCSYGKGREKGVRGRGEQKGRERGGEEEVGEKVRWECISVFGIRSLHT